MRVAVDQDADTVVVTVSSSADTGSRTGHENPVAVEQAAWVASLHGKKDGGGSRL